MKNMTERIIPGLVGTSDIISSVIDFKFSYGYAVQFTVTGTSPVGSAQVQGSIDGVNWTPISTIAVAAVGSFYDQKDAVYYPMLRLFWDFTSGTGVVVNAWLSTKGA